MRLVLVRHAAVAVDRERPARGWHLSQEGRASAEALAAEPLWTEIDRIFNSPEPKAVATAQRVAGPNELAIAIRDGLREVEGRAWVGQGYDEVVRRYLAGEAIDGWEPRDVALARMRAEVDRIVQHATGNAAIVSHGLVLTLYMAGLLDLDTPAAFELWSSIGFPDVAVVDAAAGTLERPFGQR